MSHWNSFENVPSLRERESVCVCVCLCLDYGRKSGQCFLLCLSLKYMSVLGSRDSSLVEHPTRDQKAVSSSPGRNGGRIFFSRVNCLCWLLFRVHSSLRYCSSTQKTPVILPNAHTPLIQWSRSGLTILSRHSVGTYLGNELTCNLSGNARP